MSKTLFWQTIPYLLPILSYLIGVSRNKLRVPAQIRWMLESQEIIDIIAGGIEAASSMHDKTDDEKREYVRIWAKSELYKLLNEWLPDSVINFLIEHAIVLRKSK
jgi:hypothetical protein